MATRRKAVTQESRIAKVEKRITDVSEDYEWLKILVYGKPKRGKTTFGASGPKPLIIDCNERGTLSVRKFEDVKVFRLNSWTDIDWIYWYLHKGEHDRETVVIDTVTSLSALCMKFVLGDETSRDPTRDPDMPSRPIYGKVGELMKTQILQFRNLPMNVVFLAQERRGFSEDDEEAPEVFPDVSGGIRATLTPAVDIIGRLYIKEVVKKEGGEQKTLMEHRLLIGPHEVYTTGDRSNAGLPKIVRLSDSRYSLTKIIDKIKEDSSANA